MSEALQDWLRAGKGFHLRESAGNLLQTPLLQVPAGRPYLVHAGARSKACTT